METSENPPAPSLAPAIAQDPPASLMQPKDDVDPGRTAEPLDGGAVPAVTATSETAPAPVAPGISAPAPDVNSTPVITETHVNSQPAGISSVADFIPSNAKLDQPTPSPSEPLGTGIAGVDEDSTMTDAPRDSPSNPTDTADLPAPLCGLPIIDEPVQQHTPAPEVAEPSANGIISPAASPAPQQAAVSEPHAAPVLGSDSQVNQAPTFTEAAINSSSINQPEPAHDSILAEHTGAEVKPSTEAIDTQMADSTSSLVRPREDDEMTDGPTAKRARLDESAIETPVETPVETPAAEDFKRPDIPTSAEANVPGAPAPAALVPSTPDPAAPATVTTAPAPPAPVPAVNGAATSHLPARASYSSEALTKLQKKTLEEKIKNTKKVKSAVQFLHPVDWRAMNIPNYPNVITNPMDLGTMESKLKADEYSSLEEFVSDFELMINNCFTFNGPAHAVSGMAMNLRAYFLKQMDAVPTGEAAAVPQKLVKKESPVAKPQPRRESRASTGPGAAKSPSTDTFALLPGGTPQIRRDSTAGRPKRAVVPPAPRDLPYSGVKPKRKENQVGLKFADHVLTELRKSRYNNVTMYFREPVDPVALQIPHYFSIIKHPMDIQTVAHKLKTGQYSSAEEFKADFDLIAANAMKFNPADNLVHIAAKDLQTQFELLWKGKGKWIKEHQPRSSRVSPASDAESDDGESSDDDQDGGDDEKEATIRALKEQLENMQNMLGAISGVKRDSPKAGGKKKSRASGGGSGKSKKASSSATAAKPASKPKPAKKPRLMTYDEKQEISNATENMTEEQVAQLTNIITENVSKYKDMAGDDVELEIDDLPTEVQHKLLKYVRTIFPKATREEPDDAGIDDDYEPERASKGGAGRKKHKPMKKAEQESRIAALSAKVAAIKGGMDGGAVAPPTQAESSDDEASESSEEE